MAQALDPVAWKRRGGGRCAHQIGSGQGRKDAVASADEHWEEDGENRRSPATAEICRWGGIDPSVAWAHAYSTQR
jgi:hypothetical protein